MGPADRWLVVLASGAWLAGFAIVLSAVSYHIWLAAEGGRPRRAAFRDVSWVLSLRAGMLLIGLGFGVAPRAAWWERVVWLGVSMGAGVSLAARVRARAWRGGRDGRPNRAPAKAGLGIVRLVATLGVIGILALVLPAFLAVSVNRARTERAKAGVSDVAAAIDRSRPMPSGAPAVLATSGEVPRADCCPAWIDGGPGRLADVLGSLRAGQPASQTFAPDPWGNAYLVNVGARPRAVWVLSAGPNGRVETPYDQDPGVAVLGGDDIGVRVW